MELRRVFSLLRRHFALTAFMLVVSLAATFATWNLVAPEYQGVAKALLIQPERPGDGVITPLVGNPYRGPQLGGATQLIAEIATGDDVMDRVRDLGGTAPFTVVAGGFAPTIIVTTSGSSEESTARTARIVVKVLADDLAARQAAAGVPADLRLQFEVLSQPGPVQVLNKARQRVSGATLLFGIVATFALVMLVDAGGLRAVFAQVGRRERSIEEASSIPDEVGWQAAEAHAPSADAEPPEPPPSPSPPEPAAVRADPRPPSVVAADPRPPLTAAAADPRPPLTAAAADPRPPSAAPAVVASANGDAATPPRATEPARAELDDAPSFLPPRPLDIPPAPPSGGAAPVERRPLQEVASDQPGIPVDEPPVQDPAAAVAALEPLPRDVPVPGDQGVAAAVATPEWLPGGAPAPDATGGDRTPDGDASPVARPVPADAVAASAEHLLVPTDPSPADPGLLETRRAPVELERLNVRATAARGDGRFTWNERSDEPAADAPRRPPPRPVTDIGAGTGGRGGHPARAPGEGGADIASMRRPHPSVRVLSGGGPPPSSSESGHDAASEEDAPEERPRQAPTGFGTSLDR